MFLRGFSALCLFLAAAVPFAAGFGLTTSGNALTVDTSGGLVFTGMFSRERVRL
jgi:hypothetical protein